MSTTGRILTLALMTLVATAGMPGRADLAPGRQPEVSPKAVAGPQEAEVVAVGPGKLSDDGKRSPMDVREGDRVLMGKYSGSEIKIDGNDYVILREDEILAVVSSNGNK